MLTNSKPLSVWRIFGIPIEYVNSLIANKTLSASFFNKGYDWINLLK